ncbi:GntR family transcriptional regulator [Streptomyces sp. NPDC005962]|uniref:GntR family transcriptional regulator n=1 Tax=Streptomyces sp. NPDC005962 TaxID=3154466 RepID=UPI0033E7A320
MQVAQHLVEGGLALEADAGDVGQADAALLDDGVVGEASGGLELARVGLVAAESQRGVRVSTMNSDEARQLFEIRLSLDPTAAELAARRRTDDDIATMRAAVDKLLPVTRQWGEEALTAHRTFHQALYRASHNDVLIRLLDDLWDKSDRYRRLGLELPPGDEPRTRDLQEHHQLVSLVEEGRAAEAAQLMRDHITHSLTATAISALEDREGAPTV